ncbi:putative ABC transporter-binding protein [Spirochaetota bacterium]|nr:putative ABC transporter-binding protein [Spirochaetota bacterium]
MKKTQSLKKNSFKLFRFVVVLVGLIGLMGLSGSLFSATVSISTGSVGKDVEALRTYLDMWEKDTGNTARIVTLPASTTDQFGQYKIWLGNKNSDIDVYLLDVIWAPQINQHFIDLSRAFSKEAKEHFPAIIASQTIGKKLVAIPFFTDAPMLYYRKDLLSKYNTKPPKNWEELKSIAKIIQNGERAAGNEKMWGFVFQGNAYEGLTCDALEWINSYGGGSIVDARGQITVNNPSAVKAIDFMATFVGDISPPGVLTYQEEEARGVWQLGNAVFMRNWPYAYSLGNSSDSAVRKKFDVVTLPRGTTPNSKSAATLGGWNLGISEYSKNKEAAISLVKFLAGKKIQKLNAVNLSKLPTLPALYEDKEVLKAAPFFATMKDVLAEAVGRPSGPTQKKYNEVSKEFWTAVHAVLAGDKNAKTSLAELERKLKRVRGRKW